MGHFLLIIYINDLPDQTSSISKLFAEDDKLLNRINRASSQFKFRKDIDSFLKKCEEWSMELNKDKCKMMHLGKNNPRYNYYFET